MTEEESKSDLSMGNTNFYQPSCRLGQAEHILHAVEAGFPLGQPLGGANSTAGEGVAAVSAVNEFESLADAAEDDGMLADDVTGTDRKQRDLFLGPFTDDAFATVDADFV